MTDKNTPTAAQAAKLDTLAKPSKTSKPSVPANVVVTELALGSVLYNAVAAQ